MCGIVGHIGNGDARDIVIKGLEKLEYRGYDSAGIAVLNHAKNKFEIYKREGRISNLKEIVDFDYETSFAIGHTRWATHGKPCYTNSHPHMSNSTRFIVVHNGVIENYKELIEKYLGGYKFNSETDTEVIVNLIDYFSKSLSVEEAIRKTLISVEGSYALLIIDTENKDKIYIAKNKTPLLLGQGKDGVTIASDTMALVGYCESYIILEDKTFGIVKKDKISLLDYLGMPIYYKTKPLSMKTEDISKNNYPHFMLKEIDEQPGIIRRIIQNYFNIENEIIINDKIVEDIINSEKIYFVACGTSMHAAHMGKYFFENFLKKHCEVFIASELAYQDALIVNNPYFIFISQSGETADCISVMKKCIERKHKMLAITNQESSSMNNLANDNLNIYAGKEISVASTKAYIAQVVVLAILASACAKKKTSIKQDLDRFALAVEEIVNSKHNIEELAVKFEGAKSAFYIGRGLDYYASLEAALKLKEISYIHTEGYASGELKHGTIALIEEGTPVIAIITQNHTNMITRSNLTETISRGASPIIISNHNNSQTTDDIIIPDVVSYLRSPLAVVVTQLIAYYVALMNGNDVDKPKNLAKSVTVE